MDGRLRHTAGFLSGGGDTPSPTPTTPRFHFIAVEGGSGYRLASDDDGIVWFGEAMNRKCIQCPDTDLQHFELVAYMDGDDAHKLTMTEESQPWSQAFALEGYETWIIGYDSESSQYTFNYEPTFP